MDATRLQFRLLSEIVDAFGRAGIDFWLRGGWALDFLLGELRSDHADIDLVAWQRDRDAIYDILTTAGFEHERELPDAAVDFAKNGQSIQILLLEHSPAGELVCRGFESQPFPDGMLGGPTRVLDGVSCRTLTPYALLWEKETYEIHRGRSLREKDRASILLLRRLMAAEGS